MRSQNAYVEAPENKRIPSIPGGRRICFRQSYGGSFRGKPPREKQYIKCDLMVLIWE